MLEFIKRFIFDSLPLYLKINRMLKIKKIRADFPILQRTVNGKPLVYFDNAATSQTPKVVIDAIVNYYTNHNANIHRAVYALAEESTEAYESARDKIANFVNVKNRQEIIFVRGTTEAINLVAYAWGRSHVDEGDIIVTTEYEHHSNIVPWQLLTQEKRAKYFLMRVNELKDTIGKRQRPHVLWSRG